MIGAGVFLLEGTAMYIFACVGPSRKAVTCCREAAEAAVAKATKVATVDRKRILIY